MFFAMNMGASGIAPSFAASIGARVIKKRRALWLFWVFVIMGALLLGRNVSVTLGKGLLPQGLIDFDGVLIILISATLSLFIANMLKIPQSTSQVTVGAIIGAGLYFQQVYLKTLFLKIFPMWIILPLLAYLITFLLYRKIYPPKHDNLHIYEKLFVNHKKLRTATRILSCYVAFAIGTNNVANAVGPLFGAGVIGILPGILLISPIFGIGAVLLGNGPLETAGKEIVPLGLFSAALVSFVTATLLIFASIMGVPQSLVQLNIFSIFAISSLKNGHKSTMDASTTRRTVGVWLITPLLSMLLTYVLMFLTGE